MRPCCVDSDEQSSKPCVSGVYFIRTLDVLIRGRLAFRRDLEMKPFCWSDQAGVSCGSKLPECGPVLSGQGSHG